MKHMRELTDEVLQAMSVSLLAEGIAVGLIFAATFVWIAVFATRPV